MKKRHVVLTLLVLIAVITFLDRICISVLGPTMQDELGISPKQWGWIIGVFTFAYGAFEIPTGALGDLIGRRRVLMRIVVWWSAFTILTGSVSGFGVLLVTRFMFGIGEAGAYPNISGTIARWFPTVEHARAQGFVWAASRGGGALAPFLIWPIQAHFGWRAAFWIFGALGIIWAVAWYWWYRDNPAEQPGITREELAEIEANHASASHTGIPWRVILSSRQLWLIMLMYGCYAWGAWFYQGWLSTYLVKGRGFSDDEKILYSALPFLVAVFGNLLGGYLSDVFSRRFGLRAGRIVVGSVSLAGAGLLFIGTALATDKMLVIILLSLGFGVMDLMLPAAWAICLDICPKYAGAVTGAMNTAGNLSAFFGTVLFGYLVQENVPESYNTPLLIIGGMLCVSAVLFTRIDPTRPLIPDDARQP